MIFHKTWQQVLDGRKTQTRRVVREGEWLASYTIAGPDRSSVVSQTYHTKWKVGRTYAVQPGRGQPAIWIGPDGISYDEPLAEYLRKADGIDGIRQTWGKRVKTWLREHGYKEARFRLTGIRRERLQDISIYDVYAEGIELAPLVLTADGGAEATITMEHHAFACLWNSLHRSGNRWTDNPEVWVLEFELV